MNVIQFKDADEFYARVEGYLLPNEAEHNVLFGLLGNIQHDPARYPEAIQALVEDAGAVQLVALQTDPAHNLILSKAAQTEAIACLVNDLSASGIDLVGVNGVVDESRQFAEAWALRNQCRYRINTPMRAFKLEKVKPVTGVPGTLRRAAAADRELLVNWEYAFMCEAFAGQEHRIEDAARGVDTHLDSETGGIYVWEDGGVVSYTAYKGPTPHGIRIGPVYTPPEQRGHGYASACVAGVSQNMLDAGRQFCFLFTDRRNPTSNHIYQEVGYEVVCDFTEYHFSAEAD